MLRHISVIAASLLVLALPSVALASPAKSKLRFGATSYAVAENAGSATIAVTRSARNPKSKSATNSIVTVAYATSDGTAIAGQDYTAASGRLTFPACGTSPAPSDPCLIQHISVPIHDDLLTNGNRTVKLALTSPSRNAVVVNPQKTTLTIADDEGPTHLSFDSASYTVWELGPAVEIHVIRSGAGISGSTTADFATADGSATAPGDYTTTSSTLSFGAGEVDKTVLVPITDDTAAEPTETFSVGLTNASGGATVDSASETVTILDDDTPTNAHVGFDVSAYSVGEGGDVTITVDRTNSIDSTVSVDYATVAQTAAAGVDFTAAGDTLSFDPGDTSQSFTISTLQDNLHEGDETFGVTLQNEVPVATVVDAPSTTVTIGDDDPVPTISAGAGGVANGTVSFAIDLSNPTTTPVTVDYVITDAAGNIVASGTATIPAGASGTTVTIPASGAGPWSITLGNGSGGSVDAAHSTSTATAPPPADPETTGSGSASTSTSATSTTTTTAPAALDEAVFPAGRDACRLSVRALRRVDKRGRVTARLRSSRACSVTLGASVRSSGRQIVSTRVMRSLKTKRQVVALRKGTTRTVRPRFTRRGLRFIKRALAAHRRVTLTITVIERDPRGRVTKRTLRTRLHG